MGWWFVRREKERRRERKEEEIEGIREERDRSIKPSGDEKRGEEIERVSIVFPVLIIFYLVGFGELEERDETLFDRFWVLVRQKNICFFLPGRF